MVASMMSFESQMSSFGEGTDFTIPQIPQTKPPPMSSAPSSSSFFLHSLNYKYKLCDRAFMDRFPNIAPSCESLSDIDEREDIDVPEVPDLDLERFAQPPAHLHLPTTRHNHTSRPSTVKCEFTPPHEVPVTPQPQPQPQIKICTSIAKTLLASLAKKYPLGLPPPVLITPLPALQPFSQGQIPTQTHTQTQTRARTHKLKRECTLSPPLTPRPLKSHASRRSTSTTSTIDTRAAKIADRKLRKRDSNRRAAQKFRLKKKIELQAINARLQILEVTHARLEYELQLINEVKISGH